MRQIVKRVRVKDEKGVPFLVVEREIVDTIHGVQRKRYRFELENGEVGIFVDADTFVLSETGEKFSLVTGTKRVWITES